MAALVIYRPSDNEILHVEQNVEDVQLDGQHAAKWHMGSLEAHPNLVDVVEGEPPVVGDTYTATVTDRDKYPSPQRLRQLMKTARDRIVALEADNELLKTRGQQLNQQVQALEARVTALE